MPDTLTSAVVDLGALRHNVRTLADLVAPAETMLAVKADGYGHGMVPVARAGLEAGSTSLAALEIPAALALRDSGLRAPVFAWLHGPESDFRAGIEADIELGVSALWQLHAIAAAGADRPAIVHLKVDSGLGRAGATEAEWPGVVDAALALQRAGRLRIRGAWSHLADASVADDRAARAVLLRAVERAKSRGATFEVVHLAASSAGIDQPEARLDLVRFGIAAYGVSPFSDRSGTDLGLVPVMTLSTVVIDAPASPGPARIGAGYAHGLHPPAAGVAEVQIAGRRHRVEAIEAESSLVSRRPIIGGSPATPGATVTVFGKGPQTPTVENWAKWAGTVGDEVLTRISARVPRRYV